MRCPVRSSTSRSRNARSKRALWATIAASPANETKRRIARSARGAPRSAAGRIPVSAATAGGSATPGSTSVSNASPSSSERTRCAPISQIREVRGESPVVSRSTTTKCACSRRTSAPGGSASPTEVPRHARRASPETTSSRSERASAAGALASAKSARAASSAGTGPRRASTSSTSRSAASNESCIAADGNRTYVRSQRRGVRRPFAIAHCREDADGSCGRDSGRLQGCARRRRAAGRKSAPADFRPAV